MSVILKSTCRTLPTGYKPISAKFNQGLADVVFPVGDRFRSYSGLKFTKVGATETPTGTKYVGDASGAYAAFGAGHPLDISDVNVVVMAVVTLSSLTNDSTGREALLTTSSSASINGGFYLDYCDGHSVRFWVNIGGTPVVAELYVTPKLHESTVFIGRKGADGLQVYCSTSMTTSLLTVATGAITKDTIRFLNIGAYLDGTNTGRGTHGVFHLGAVWRGRNFNKGEIYSLLENPYQIFEDAKRIIYCGAVGGPNTYYQTNAGALGVSAIQPGRWIYTTKGGIVVATAVTPSKGVYATQEGSLVATGGVPKTIFGTQEGSLGCDGIPSKMIGKNVAGSVTHSGNISRLVSSALAGNVTSAGTIAKLVQKALAAELDLSGDVSKVLTGLNYQELTGTIAFSGTLSKQVLTSLVGTIAGSGVLGKSITHILSGNATQTGTINKQITKALAGTVTISGNISRLVSSALAGNVSAAGAITKIIAKALSSEVALSGTTEQVIEGLTFKALAGSIAASGTLTKQVLTNLVGSIASSGVLGKAATKTLAGNATSTGAIVKQISKALTGSLTTSATVDSVKTAYVAPAVDVTAIVDAIFAYPVEGTITFKEAIRLILAACAGDITYSAGTSQVIAAGGTKARVTAKVTTTTRDVETLDVTD